MSPDTLFQNLSRRIEERPELRKEVGAVYQFDVSGPEGGSWTVNLRDEPIGVETGATDDADCVITVGPEDLAGILNGTVDPQMAFMMGRVKVAGNFMLATRLRALL